MTKSWGSKLFKNISLVTVVACLVVFVSCSVKESALMDAQMVAEMNKPGVVLIERINTTTVSVAMPVLNVEKLQAKITSMIDNGEIEYTDQAIMKAWLDELLSYPEEYIHQSGDVRTQEIQTGGTGTGFIVTPNGYIITNAHVAAADKEAMKSDIVNEQLETLIEAEVEAFIDSAEKSNYIVTDAEINQLKNISVNYYINHMQLSNIETSLSAYMAVTIPGVQTNSKRYQCEVIKIGEPAPGKDVAILKMEGKNLPTVRLGDDMSMKTGQNLYVIGYPGAATFNEYLASESWSESTFTQGVMSARKPMSGGWDSLQFDAAIAPGNSGGPLFNDNGDAIGIVTFGSEENYSMVQGMNFAVPISIAKQFLGEINVEAEEGELTKEYRDALALYRQGKYKKALEKFRDIYEVNPGYPYVQGYISECRNAINK